MAMTADDASTPAVRPLAEVVLYAEFDLTKGSTLRASYPTPFAHYSPEFFADIMLPEGVHNREEDFTIFFLNRQNAYKLSDTEEQKSNESQEQTADEAQDPLQSFMYCLSVVRTTHDTAARRGAKVTAVALCSTHKSCFALKDVLNLAVLKIVGSKSEEESEKVLQELLAVVNAVDISGVRGLSSMERRLMKRTISSTGRAAANWEDAKTLEKALFFRTQAMWEDIPIPLQFKICSTDDQHDDGTLTQLLQTFGDQTMVLFNAVLTGQRVIMLGYNRPAGEVCNFVLATSSLVCPPLFGLIHRQYPYANLTDLGFLSTPGTSLTKREWWDVLCDISTGEVFVSAPVEKEDHDASDRNFVLDGVAAGYDEEWVRCMFEEYMLKNVVDIALGEANYLSPDALAKRSAVNNKRITKWARTDSYKRFMDSPHRMHFHSPAKYTLYTDIEKTGVDMKRHIRSLQGDMVVLDDTLVEKIYSDFATLLNTELELQEFLSFLPVLRGGLQTIAQGIFHPSITSGAVLVNHISMQRLNPFLLMSYQRIHDIVNPDTRD
ncbi:Arf3-interacting protein 1, N-terminal domain [Phytophthora cactorum]|nr:Arf3-interacting protein 1, N-terminal domain [Phytophthora cactorum]